MLARPSSTLPAVWRDRVQVVASDDLNRRNLRRILDTPVETVFHPAPTSVRPAGSRRCSDHAEAQCGAARDIGAALRRVAGALGDGRNIFSESSRFDRAFSSRFWKNLRWSAAKLYGSSKAAGGLTASAVAHSKGVGFRLLRFVQGVRSGLEAAHRLLPALVSGLGRNGARVAISAGTQVLDFVYIDDVVEAMLRAAAHCRENAGTAIWNVATGRAHSVRDFANHVAAAMNADPSLLGFGGVAMRNDDVPWAVSSSELLRSELGWQPSVQSRTRRYPVGAVKRRSASTAISGIAGRGDRVVNRPDLETRCFNTRPARRWPSVMAFLLVLDISGFRQLRVARVPARSFAGAERLPRLRLAKIRLTASRKFYMAAKWMGRIDRALGKELGLREACLVAERILRPHFHYDPAFEALGPRATLFGYFQSERYFSAIATSLRDGFRPRDPFGGPAAAALARIETSRLPVSVHVRRGDYLNSGTKEVHGILE